MNNHQASPYQNFFQHRQNVTTGGNFHNAAATVSVCGIGPVESQPNVATAFMLGQRNVDGFYHHQSQHVPLVYHQPMDTTAVTPNQLFWSHQQQQLRVPPSIVPAPGSQFNPTSPFGVANYYMPVGSMETQLSDKQQPPEHRQHFPTQPSSALSLFSVFGGQPQQLVADRYYNVISSHSASTTDNPLAGLRALSDNYTCQGAYRTQKSQSSSSVSTTSAECIQKRVGGDSVKPATPVASSPTAPGHPTTNSPQQSTAFVPPSPLLKSQTSHSSPMSSTTTHSNHMGGSFLVNSPATPGLQSASSCTSDEARANSTSVACGNLVDTVANSFSMSSLPSHQYPHSYEDVVTHQSAMSSFYAAQTGMDPSTAVIDPALFGSHVVGSDPSLHAAAVDDALSVLSRDVNLGDLSDINCANMMVGHNFWDDLGDAVLDDPLLGSHAGVVCSSSNSVDLVNCNNLATSAGTSSGVLLHSVLEFGTENGHQSVADPNVFRFQEDLKNKRDHSIDLTSTVTVSTDSVVSGSVHSAQSDATLATPKLREKMKRKAQGENELAEIDRAFARHLSMVAEKDEVRSAEYGMETKDLDALTADICLQNRIRWKPPNVEEENEKEENLSPLQITEISSVPLVDLELEELKKNIRKIMYATSVGDRKKNQSAPISVEPTDPAKPVEKRPAKVPIYKQTRWSNEKILDGRGSGGHGGNADTMDSPYNFTEDEDGTNGEEKGNTSNDGSAQMDQSNSTGIGEFAQRILDAEVAKKLLHISTLHPELKMGGKQTGDGGGQSRHVVPKKRQQWQVSGDGELGFRRMSVPSASTFVKTEIITDDISTAMPSSVRRADSLGGLASFNKDTDTFETPSPTNNGSDRALLPKLIIRIPRKCLEENEREESEKEDKHRRHSHRKRKREKRQREDWSEQEGDGRVEQESGERKRSRKHRRSTIEGGQGDVNCMDADEKTGRRRNTSENEICDQDGHSKAISAVDTVHGEKKQASDSNGFESDHLPFKLRKKLRRLPSGPVEETMGPTSANGGDCGSGTMGTLGNGASTTKNNVDDQLAEMEMESKELTSLRLRFPSGPVFQKGAFVVRKEDIGKPECPLWKVDSQNLLQKFSPLDRHGRPVYISTSTFAGWCLQNQDLYASVQVRFVTQSRSECVVELESSLEEIFPAVSTEFTDERQRNAPASTSGTCSTDPSTVDPSCVLLQHPQAEALAVYLNVLLLHAVVGNCLQTVQRDIGNNGAWTSRIKEVDLTNTDKCRTLLSCVKWQLPFKESLEWYSHCTVSEDESFGLQCQACGTAVVCNVLQLFANEGYDFDTLEARAPRTTATGSPLPSQDYHLCSSCASVAVRYHKLFHMRYHLFRKCEDAIELTRDGDPTLAVGAVVDACMQNKKWLSNTLNEYLQLWSTLC